jgi:hypothetical protein
MNDPLIYELGAPKFVAISPVGDLCTTTPAFDLVGSAPGIWSGALNGVGLSIPLDPALLGPGTYSVTLSVTSTGECPGSATADFVVDICSGIEEVADVHPTLSPNPFVHRSVLLLQGAGATTVELFDATGRKINSQMLIATGPTPIDVDLSGQQAGTYLIVVHTNGTTHRLRAVKAE